MIVVALGLATATARSELFLTAEVLPTTGLTGFDTYRITATSDLGNIVGLDFSEVGGYGVFGSLNQVQPLGLATTYHDASWIADDGRSQDTHFLLNGSDVVSLFNSESTSSLHGIFALAGDLQLSAGRNLPFLQITTQDLGSVSLRGMSVARRTDGELFEETLDIRLSDISIGLPPDVPLRPIPVPVVAPPPIVEPPPVVEPPVLEPPVVTQPDPLTPTPGPTVVNPNSAPEPPILGWEEILERERDWRTFWHAERVGELINVWREGEWIVGDPTGIFQMPEGDIQIFNNTGVIDSGIALPYLAEDGQLDTTVTAWDGDASQLILHSQNAGNPTLQSLRDLRSALITGPTGSAFGDAVASLALGDSLSDALSNAAQAPEPTSFLSLLIACAAVLTCARPRHRERQVIRSNYRPRRPARYSSDFLANRPAAYR
jgi:hypothetical protein